MELTSRLLDFPTRAAAVASFLADLKARGLGDVGSLQAAINDAALWDEVLGFWRDREWVRPAPHSPMHVFPGEGFEPGLTLREFCGEGFGAPTTDPISE
ncbi:MAG: hypothetical protein ACRD16_05200 [Thermoanaerobaculia bacterium]